jgi:hypothetical protein
VWPDIDEDVPVLLVLSFITNLMVNATTSTGQVKIPPYKLIMRAEKRKDTP